MRALLFAVVVAWPAIASGEEPKTHQIPVVKVPEWIASAYEDFAHAQNYRRQPPCGYWDRETDRLIDPVTPEGKERYLRGEECIDTDFD